MANTRNNKKTKTLKIKSTSKEYEQFERVKLDETKIITGKHNFDSDNLVLEDLKLQLQSATDKNVIANLKKEIKSLEKKIIKNKK